MKAIKPAPVNMTHQLVKMDLNRAQRSSRKPADVKAGSRKAG
ncbi:hypothetical protein [Afipia sp. OHSU_I-C4]|nr:hypothetical protein [Afipia sp. OHSU_I-C4]